MEAGRNERHPVSKLLLPAVIFCFPNNVLARFSVNFKHDDLDLTKVHF